MTASFRDFRKRGDVRDSLQRGSCYDKAVELLARRPHFRRQLEEKLRRREYGDEEIAATLNRLETQGYLDDVRLAKEVASQRGERAGEGARRVRSELLRRGAPEAAVDEALAESFAADDTEAAAAAARSWRERGGKQTAALARHLDRKGFSRRAILSVLRSLGAEAEDAD
jgi:regulatory protein